MNERYERILNGAGIWASYYRANPARFVEEYLHIKLRTFQKILITMMGVCATFVYIASRGQGKTYLCAIYCCWRAILYPNSKICIASGTRGQAGNILAKIDLELKPRSPELANEIESYQNNGVNSIIVFKNGSYIKVVTAGESARGERAHVLIIDEFRLVRKDTIDTILKKFLASAREPAYSELSDAERDAEIDKEQLVTQYLSSAFFQDHWSFTKCVDTLRDMMLGGGKSFICGLPWQLAATEKLLKLDEVYSQMSESDFTEVKWAMEMEAIWWGIGDGSFFDYATVSKNRSIQFPMLPSALAARLGNDKRVKIPDKKMGEIRILSADIALMMSRKFANDASAIFINQMLPSRAGRYMNNIVYCDSAEGLHTEDQALMLRRLFEEFKCDYIVIDCQGVGLGVFDALARDIVDPATGEIFPALSCCNDQTMAERCTTPGAAKVIWSIKANAALNSDCAVLLREGFRSGCVRLLVTEYDGDDVLSAISQYNKLPAPEQVLVKMPYIHTTLLIDELVKLQHEESGGRVKLSEKSGARKDRYSSLSYNYYVAKQLENKNSRKMNRSDNTQSAFIIRAPKYTREVVDRADGRSSAPAWKRDGW